MVQLDQTKTRAKTSTKVALDEVQEKDAAEQEVERRQQFLQTKRARTHPTTCNVHEECDKQSLDDWDLTDYRRETVRIQNRRSVTLGSREDVPTPQKGQEDPIPHSVGVHDPKIPADYQHFVRDEDVVLGVSFNTQSQDPDIPFISTRVAISQYISSLQTQSKTPDIPLLSLHVSTEEVLVSFNVQDQASDDPSVPDRQCAPCDFFATSPHFRQVFSRLSIRVSTESCQMTFDFPSSDHQIPVRTPTTDPQVFSRKEFNDQSWEVSWTQDVVNWTSTTGPLARLPTKHQILHLLIQFMSQDRVHVLPSDNQNSPYQDF